MCRHFLAVVVGLIGLGVGVCLADDVTGRLEDERARAQALQREKEKARRELEETLKREKQVLGHLDRIDRQSNRLRRENLELQKEIASVQGSLDEAQGRLAALKGEIRSMEGAFHRRIAALYKIQRAGYPALLLSARSPQDALRRYHYLLCIVKQDAQALLQIRFKVKEWERARVLHRERKEELLALHHTKLDQQREIRLQRTQKRSALAALHDQKELQESTLREYEEASSRLQDLVRSLEGKARREPEVPPAKTQGTVRFERLKGNLPLPVQGTVRTRFGKQFHPLLKTYAVNNGIEIEAPEGEAIRAVYPGEVVFSGWLKGYGNVLIIDHGGGYYSLSGHAFQLLKGVGEQVSEGDVIGYVGDTGPLGGPSLYFEIRKGGKPLNPLNWLRPQPARAKRG